MRVLLYNPTAFGLRINRDLLYGCWCVGKRVANILLPNCTLAGIAAFLRRGGFQIELFDENVEGELNPDVATTFDVVVVLSNTTTFRNDCKKVEALKRHHPDLLFVCMGQHVTALPDSILGTSVDIGIVGEPELPLQEVLQNVKTGSALDSIPGAVMVSESGVVVCDKPGRIVENLDVLPFPDRGKMRKKGYFFPLARKRPFTTVTSSRGCRGSCIFCTSPFFYRGTYRQRSAESVLEELRQLRREGFREVLFRDEDFTSDPLRLSYICESLLKENIDISWMCNTVVGRLRRQDMLLMKRSGCHTLMCGVESGDPEVLRSIHKRIDPEQVLNTFSDARSAGLSTHAHFLVGNPGETQDSLSRSLSLLKKIKATTLDVGIVYPFPGSLLYGKMKKKVPDLDSRILRDAQNIHLQAFDNDLICCLSPADLAAAVSRFYRRFYSWPGTWVRNLGACTTPYALLNRMRSALSVLSQRVG